MKFYLFVIFALSVLSWGNDDCNWGKRRRRRHRAPKRHWGHGHGHWGHGHGHGHWGHGYGYKRRRGHQRHYKGAGRKNHTGANASAHYGVVASRADGKGAASFGKGAGVATNAFRKSDDFAVNGDEWDWWN